MAQTSRDDPQLKLRITPQMKTAIEAAARSNNRTMNAEIVARLELSLSDEASVHSKLDEIILLIRSKAP